MTTAYVTDVRYTEHTLEGHPENASRLYAIWDRLEATGILDDLTELEPVLANYNQLDAVHQRRYLEVLENSAQQSGLRLLDASDTYLLPESFYVARIAAGGLLRAVDAVLSGDADNGIAIIRPPGHHATPAWGMGFCLLNNVAIAARYAQRAFELERILIVDYDVHHGNGTQDTFYDDPDVLFVSTHQYPFYPGTGALNETGTGAHTTLNIPLPAGIGDTGYATIYEQIVWPAARRFKPQLILVSMGFDAHWGDPLAGMQLSLHGYAHLTRQLIEMAKELCGGRIVFTLEGGYNLDVLSNGVLNVCYALLGKDQINDPLGMARQGDPPVDMLLGKIKQTHHLD